MDPLAVGTLVRVDLGRTKTDGIVFDVPNTAKAVVALVDPKRGPVLRTVDRSTLSERTEAGDTDRALELLVRRTAPAVGGSSRPGAPTGRGREAHTRGAAHRPTGR